VFVRDRHRFEQGFSALELQRTSSIGPIRYPLSRGVSMWALVPSWGLAPLRIAGGHSAEPISRRPRSFKLLSPGRKSTVRTLSEQ
jgi:hypothetical protein